MPKMLSTIQIGNYLDSKKEDLINSLRLEGNNLLVPYTKEAFSSSSLILYLELQRILN